MKKGIVAAAVVIVVVIGVFAVMHKSSYKSGSNGSSSSSSNSSSSSSSNTGSNVPSAATITYDGNGFSPANVTVKSGDTVTVKNTSSQDVQFDSDPHPVHTDDPDLNLGSVAPGQSGSFKVTKTGSFGYHNHLDPSQTGNITIN